MNTKIRTLLISCTTLTLMMLLSSCSASGSLEIDCDAFMEMPHQVDRIEVREGDEFTLRLCSNPSTGNNWVDDAEISDIDVVRQDHQEFTAPGDVDDPPAPGTPGTHTWTFSALRAGESTITFEYSQLWDGGEKNTWTFTLTVVVE